MRAGGSLALVAALVLSGLACASPPRNLDDLCSIFREKPSWQRAAQRTRERWGVPSWVQLAIVHQESRFQARARPARKRYLGFIPGPRPSSAYGYGQVITSTWDRYRRESGERFADRNDFGDVSDFIGWYAHWLHERGGMPLGDARQLYLAYHEGPAGFRAGSHLRKPWLLAVSAKVDARAERYRRQSHRCTAHLATQTDS